ncbi:hypothetical protein [Lacticaseibacillus saniviri]|nr:hypothetical protein [Lacticaseibacillus saniviri]
MVTRTIVARLNFNGVTKDVTIKNVKAVPDSPNVALVNAPKFAGYTTFGGNPMRIYLFGPNTTYHGKLFQDVSMMQYFTPGYKHPEMPARDPQLGTESGYLNNQLAKVTYTIPSAADGQVYTMDKNENITATSQKLVKGTKWRITQMLSSDNGNNWLNAGKNTWLKLRNYKLFDGSAVLGSFVSFYPVSTVTRNGGAHVYSTVNNNFVATSRVLPKGSSWSTKAASNEWLNIGGDQWLRFADVHNHKKTTTSNTPSNKATMTSKSLKHGTTWRVSLYRTIDGVISWYNLGGNQWIQAKYAVAVK